MKKMQKTLARYRTAARFYGIITASVLISLTVAASTGWAVFGLVLLTFFAYLTIGCARRVQLALDAIEAFDDLKRAADTDFARLSGLGEPLKRFIADAESAL